MKSRREGAFLSGLEVLAIRAIGSTVHALVRESMFGLMDACMKANGRMGSVTDLAPTPCQMGQWPEATGSMAKCTE